MTVDELLARFPEIPRDLGSEPLLAELAEKCGSLLALATKPTPCATDQDAGNHYYLKLVGPLAIHGYGLSSRDKVLGQIRELLDRRDDDPEGFGASLLPEGVASGKGSGTSCA